MKVICDWNNVKKLERIRRQLKKITVKSIDCFVRAYKNFQ